MSSTDIAIPSAVAGQELADYKEQVKLVVNTDFVPKAYRGNVYACLAAMLYGREIGLAPMESLNEVYMVDGKPSLSAKAMLKRARQFGHSVSGETDETKAVVRGKRADTGDELTVTYTIEMAKRAGLLSKQNWQKMPEDMLWARAVSRLCRRLFSDAFGALPYGPEELETTAEDRIGEALSSRPPDDAVVIQSDFGEESGAGDQSPSAGSTTPAPDEPLTNEVEAEQQSLAEFAPKDVQETLKGRARRSSQK